MKSDLVIEYGHCHCGCGQKTPLAKQSSTARGVVKDQPLRYIHGHNGYNQRTLSEIFWSNCQKGALDECWEWTGSRHPFGYGTITFNRKRVLAHRLSYELHNGPIPDGKEVCHECDNPPCCNPQHLFLGTQSDNMKDAANKNRFPSGESHPSVKLFASDIPRIREMASTVSQNEIAKRFGCSRSAIQAIVEGRTWRHIP